jgi:tripartite-type tricarboxylate transporter receptor subunit TctC
MKKAEWLTVLFLVCSTCLLFDFVPNLACAAADFPTKEVTIIVNSNPGGGRDVIARGVANTMSKHLSTPVVVLNVAGASGMRGLEQLYNSPPDGYTVGIGTPSDIILQFVEKPKYDSKKFIYIGNAQHTPDFFFVKSDSPIRSIKDFKSFGKKVRIGTHILTSNGTVAYMILAEREGFTISIVAGYKGIPEVTLGLIRGEIEANDIVASAAMQFFRAGQIRPIAVIGEKRSPLFPDVPTIGEAGYPELANFALYYWFMAPPGLSKGRAQVLEDALMKTLKDPEFLNWAKGAGVDVASLSSQETTKLVSDFSDIAAKYQKVVQKYAK